MQQFLNMSEYEKEPEEEGRIKTETEKDISYFDITLDYTAVRTIADVKDMT